jgi:hypothetical protein
MKRLNPSIQAGISYSTKQLGWRLRRRSVLLQLTLLASCSCAGSLLARNVGNEARLVLMASHAETQQFYHQKQEFARSKELERTNIPQYNIELSLAVSRFHKHIADMHQRHVTCSICRKQVKQIRDLAKKIDQGMK